MNSIERHECRYQRRKAKRLQHREKRCQEVGDIKDVFTFHDLYFNGKKCCNGVRWKQSTQNFEAHLFSRTAVALRKLKSGKWKPKNYHHFELVERGKARTIDAPHINDRQVHRTLTQKVLYPLYIPTMIYDNGASLKGKGLHFTYKRLKQKLHEHYDKYGLNGWVIQIDLKDFFPSAPHSLVYDRHEKYIYNEEIRKVLDKIIESFSNDNGMLLGVEPSQLEMVALPSFVDNYIKCQLGVSCAIHYMDDYVMVVETKEKAIEVMNQVVNMFNDAGMEVNLKKTHIQPLSKSFRFCKCKFQILPSGKIITHGYRKGVSRSLRKMKKFFKDMLEGKHTQTLLHEWLKSAAAYYKNFNDHGRVLKLYRMFYTIFGYNPSLGVV